MSWLTTTLLALCTVIPVSAYTKLQANASSFTCVSLVCSLTEGSNRERRIQAVAALSGVRVKHVDVDHAFTQSDEYRKKWQMGSAPAFESDDGLCLNDSGAISMYGQSFPLEEESRFCSIQVPRQS